MSKDERQFDHTHFKRELDSRLKKREVREKLYRELGLPQRTVNSWLTERSDTRKTSMPGLDKAVIVARAFNLSLDYLATGREYWPEMNHGRLKRLVLQLRALDDRSLRAVEATVRELAVGGGAVSTAQQDEQEDEAGLPSRGS